MTYGFGLVYFDTISGPRILRSGNFCPVHVAKARFCEAGTDVAILAARIVVNKLKNVKNNMMSQFRDGCRRLQGAQGLLLKGAKQSAANQAYFCATYQCVSD